MRNVGISTHTGIPANEIYNLKLSVPLFLDTSLFPSTKLSNISIDNAGSGYGTGTLSVTISGTGVGATATATQYGGIINTVAITNAGTGYTEVPTVTLTNPNGSGTNAVLTATLGSIELAFQEATTNDTITLPAGITGNVAVLRDGLDLGVPGDLGVNGNLVVGGNATILGNLTFGDAMSDTVQFVADVDSDIIPEVSGTYDLGSHLYPWDDIYVHHLRSNHVGGRVLLTGGSSQIEANSLIARNTVSTYMLEVGVEVDGGFIHVAGSSDLGDLYLRGGYTVWDHNQDIFADVMP